MDFWWSLPSVIVLERMFEMGLSSESSKLLWECSIQSPLFERLDFVLLNASVCVGWSRDLSELVAFSLGSEHLWNCGFLLCGVGFGVMVTVYEFSRLSTGRLSQGLLGSAAERFTLISKLRDSAVSFGTIWMLALEEFPTEPKSNSSLGSSERETPAILSLRIWGWLKTSLAESPVSGNLDQTSTPSLPLQASSWLLPAPSKPESKELREGGFPSFNTGPETADGGDALRG